MSFSVYFFEHFASPWSGQALVYSLLRRHILPACHSRAVSEASEECRQLRYLEVTTPKRQGRGIVEIKRAKVYFDVDARCTSCIVLESFCM